MSKIRELLSAKNGSQLQTGSNDLLRLEREAIDEKDKKRRQDREAMMALMKAESSESFISNSEDESYSDSDESVVREKKIAGRKKKAKERVLDNKLDNALYSGNEAFIERNLKE